MVQTPNFLTSCLAARRHANRKIRRKHLRRNTKFSCDFSAARAVAHWCENIPLSFFQNMCLSVVIPPRAEGRSANRHDT
jgi:hypothetical protein